AVFTTEVNRGVQLIDYKFTRICSEHPKRKTASQIHGRSHHSRADKDSLDEKPIKKESLCNSTFEEGTLVLSVIFTDHYVDGLKILKPINCKK
ncbi:MAG: hypothetical protein KDD40_04990, partial [Bdellovibrionales bacterium]|nr:hypothetical protein [Bdellovibrionales bacterium]